MQNGQTCYLYLLDTMTIVRQNARFYNIFPVLQIFSLPWPRLATFPKGRSIYYVRVRTKGGEGVKEVPNFANNSTDGLRETAQ